MSGVGKNPWAARLLSKTQNKLLGQDTCLKKSFVLLENVAGNFTTPCILDLKVGTRLYGDDCPSDKIQRHYEKDKLSTTSSLGVRLSGMQVYQNSRYVCRDKFFGRGLSETGFYHSLRMFLHDGIRIRTEVIAPILLMLENVIVDLNTLTTYRLYGASLIIMYEGVDYDVKQREKQHCLRYDHSQIKQQDSNKTLSKFYSGNPSNHQESSLPSSVHTKEKMMATVRRQSKVDVRIVDFAHCTTSKLTKCIKHHSGPDAGFIFGLKNLVKMLKQIEEEEDV